MHRQDDPTIKLVHRGGLSLQPRQTKYLSFKLTKDAGPDRKTQVWSIHSVKHGDLLGHIAWLGNWRQYSFQPASGTLFNVDCMKTICAFIEELMADRRGGMT